MAKTKSPKEVGHVLHKLLPRETCERQPSSQRWYGEGNECRVSCGLLFIQAFQWDVVVELEVLKVRQESNEIQDLSARSSGLFEGKESKCW